MPHRRGRRPLEEVKHLQGEATLVRSYGKTTMKKEKTQDVKTGGEELQLQLDVVRGQEVDL